jgi:hypothetical protein
MTKAARRLVICLRNTGYEASLEPRKLYAALPDPEGERHSRIRVIDESGEDYLYPVDFFVEADLSQTARRAVMQLVDKPQ